MQHCLRAPVFWGPCCLAQCVCKNDEHCLPRMGYTLMFLLTSVIDCSATTLDMAGSAYFAEFDCPTIVLLQDNRTKKYRSP